MRKLWEVIDSWCSPPHRFESVVRAVDIMLQATDKAYRSSRVRVGDESHATDDESRTGPEVLPRDAGDRTEVD